jgi:NAD-dependent DNA ligase
MEQDKLIEILGLQRFLIRCCYWYYVKANPIISDREFDRQFQELQTLEDGKSYSMSPTQMIYGDCEGQYPEWAKIREGGLA